MESLIAGPSSGIDSSESEPIVLVEVVAQQMFTAAEVSQWIPRSPAKKLIDVRFISLLSRLKSPRPNKTVV